MKYGTKESTKVLDSNGSTMTTVHNIVAEQIVPPVRVKYAERIKVSGQEDEHREYIKFSDEINTDKGMLDPFFTIEATRLSQGKDFYYIVRNYTRLQH